MEEANGGTCDGSDIRDVSCNVAGCPGMNHLIELGIERENVFGQFLSSHLKR